MSKEYREQNKEKLRDQRRKKYYEKRGIKPGDIRVKAYEQKAIDYLQSNFNGYSMHFNKTQYSSGCAGDKKACLFPDVLIENTVIPIIVEVDENAHRGAHYSCDWVRMQQLTLRLQTPVFFIRYNPMRSNLETLGEILKEIIQDMSNNPGVFVKNNIDELLGFGVKYLGYNQHELEIAEARAEFSLL